MKAIHEYGFVQGEWTIIHSPINNVAGSLGWLRDPDYTFQARVNELTTSYFNQQRFIIDTYTKIYGLFQEINNAENDSLTHPTERDYKILDLEPEIRNYSYLFIVSLQTALDLFICVVDFVQNQKFREEHLLPAFASYPKKVENPIPEIKDKMDIWRTVAWIKSLKDIRNRIVHRGYLLKPEFSFQKTNNLEIKLYIGTNFYPGFGTGKKDGYKFDLGELFDNFVTQMPLIEKEFANILLNHISEFQGKISVELSLKYSGSYNQYNIKELYPHFNG